MKALKINKFNNDTSFQHWEKMSMLKFNVEFKVQTAMNLNCPIAGVYEPLKTGQGCLSY